jgi:hypothetical protein
MMKLRYLPLLIMLYIVPTTIAFAGTIEKIAELIKQGNAHELSKYFSSNVEITILDDGNVYSKAQSEMILEKFFKDNKPRTVKLLHRINSNSTYNFGVLILSTDKGNYRVSYTLKEVEKVMVVIELRIETEKT